MSVSLDALHDRQLTMNTVVSGVHKTPEITEISDDEGGDILSAIATNTYDPTPSPQVVQKHVAVIDTTSQVSLAVPIPVAMPATSTSTIHSMSTNTSTWAVRTRLALCRGSTTCTCYPTCAQCPAVWVFGCSMCNDLNFCDKPRYCSTTCQRKHWSTHRIQCGGLPPSPIGASLPSACVTPITTLQVSNEPPIRLECSFGTPPVSPTLSGMIQSDDCRDHPALATRSVRTIEIESRNSVLMLVTSREPHSGSTSGQGSITWTPSTNVRSSNFEADSQDVRSNNQVLYSPGAQTKKIGTAATRKRNQRRFRTKGLHESKRAGPTPPPPPPPPPPPTTIHLNSSGTFKSTIDRVLKSLKLLWKRKKLVAEQSSPPSPPPPPPGFRQNGRNRLSLAQATKLSDKAVTTMRGVTIDQIDNFLDLMDIDTSKNWVQVQHGQQLAIKSGVGDKISPFEDLVLTYYTSTRTLVFRGKKGAALKAFHAFKNFRFQSINEGSDTDSEDISHQLDEAHVEQPVKTKEEFAAIDQVQSTSSSSASLFSSSSSLAVTSFTGGVVAACTTHADQPVWANVEHSPQNPFLTTPCVNYGHLYGGDAQAQYNGQFNFSGVNLQNFWPYDHNYHNFTVGQSQPNPYVFQGPSSSSYYDVPSHSGIGEQKFVDGLCTNYCQCSYGYICNRCSTQNEGLTLTTHHSIPTVPPYDLDSSGKQLGKAYSSDAIGDGPAGPRSRPVRTTQTPKKFAAIETLKSVPAVTFKSPVRLRNGKRLTVVDDTVIDFVVAITGIGRNSKGGFMITATWDCHDGSGIDGVKDYELPATDTFHLHEMLCDYLDNQIEIPSRKRSLYQTPRDDVVRIIINKHPQVRTVMVYFRGQSNPVDAYIICKHCPKKITDFFKALPTRSGDDIGGYTFCLTEDEQLVQSDGNYRDVEDIPSSSSSSSDAADDFPDSDGSASPINHDDKDDCSDLSEDMESCTLNFEEITTTRANRVFTNPYKKRNDSLRAQEVEKVLTSTSVFSPFTTLPVSDEDIQDVMIPFLATLYVKSRALQKLKPCVKWHSEQKVAWRRILTKHLLWLDNELNEWERTKDDLHLLNIVAKHLALPVDGLLPSTSLKACHDSVNLSVANDNFQFVIPASDGNTRFRPTTPVVERSKEWLAYSGEQKVVRSTIKTVLNGQSAKAQKVWSSFGTAPKTQEVANVTIAMHPNHGNGVSPRDPTLPPSSNYSSALCEKRIIREARGVSSIDATGWSPDYFACVINLMSSERRNYVQIIARFVGVLTKHPTIPKAVAFAVGTGALTMLNKIPEAENLCLIRSGAAPKVRPVNSGTDISKKIGRAIIDSNHGKVINKRLINQFQGRSKGCQKVGLIAAAAYDSGKVVTKNDKKNAFNEFEREKILQGVKNLWPSGYPAVYTYYGLTRSPVFYMYRDVNNQWCLLVTYSTEGVKQGCCLGSYCYAMGAEYNIFSTLRKAYPEVDICAITDDQIDIWDAPGPGSTQSDWDVLYVKIAGFKKMAKELGNAVHLFDAPDKESILIPEYGFLPSHHITDETGLKVTKTGFVIGGLPVGPQGHKLGTARSKVDLSLGRLELAKKFNDIHPQFLFNTILRCINKSMDYLAGGVPTNIIVEELHRFDVAIHDAVFCILRTPIDLIDPYKLYLSETLLTLPSSSNGAGLVPISRKAPMLFLDSVMQASKEKMFRKNSLVLLPDVSEVYGMLLSSFGIDHIDCNHPLANILPCSALELLQFASTRMAKATLPIKGKVKLLMVFLHDELRIKLIQAVLDQSTPSDKVHFLTILTSSIYHKFLNVDLRDKFFHMDGEVFRFSLSFFLGLPFPSGQHYTKATYVPNLGYPAITCVHHNKIIDATGNHASSCNQCYGARQSLHRSLINTCIFFLKKAEFTATFEPSLKAILGPMDEKTARLFPKASSKVGRSNTAIAREVLNHNQDKTREGQMAALNVLVQSLPDVPRSDLGSIRPDFLAVPNDGKGSSYCGDFTAIQPSCDTYIKDSLSDLIALATIDIEMSGMNFRGLQSRFDRVDSTTVAKAVDKKKDKYQLISDLANLRSCTARRSRPMEFIPAVVTHNGQLNFELFTFIENVTTRFRRIDQSRFDIDGLDAQQRACNFRLGFKNSLIFSLASNWGNQLRWGVLRGCT